MTISSTGRFTFQRTSSAWQVHEAWRTRRREAAENYLAQTSAATAAFANAASDQIQGMAELAANAAVNRIRTAASVSLSV